jgi:hypothetical protein
MTKKIKSIIYGEGGYDESKPDNNVISYEYYSEEELTQLELQAKAEADKAALLNRLGITQEEAQLLLGGN